MPCFLFERRSLPWILRGLLWGSSLSIVLALTISEISFAVEVRSAMLTDPTFEPLKSVVVLPNGTVKLWLSILRSGDSGAQREACFALIRAHRLDIEVRTETLPVISELLNKSVNSPIVLRALARTTTALDLKELAPQLADLLQESDRDLQGIVEPALARWQYAPMADIWKKRLTDKTSASRSRIFAYQGLGQLHDRSAVDLLVNAVEASDLDFAERWAAAKGFADLAGPKCDAVAAKLARGNRDDHFLAAAALAHSDGSKALHTLEQLALDDDSTVAALAWERLIAIDPAACLAPAGHWRTTTSTRLRLLVIRSFALNPSPESLAAIVPMLDDPHPEVRTKAADVLVKFAKSVELLPTLEQVLATALGSDNSLRTIEQAALIAGTIHNVASASRLIELLQSSDNAVSIAAAWALSELALDNTGPAIFEVIQRETQRTEEIVQELRPIYAANPQPGIELPKLEGVYGRVEHLILALGRMQYHDAAPMLARYVTKPVPQVRGEPPTLQTFKQDRLRAAAIWTLGHLYDDKTTLPPDPLVDALVDRMTDTTPIPAESNLVRQMAAVSLGRLGRKELLPKFEAFFDPHAKHNQVGRACGWALEVLSGTPPMRSLTEEITYLDWFLVPIHP